MTAGTAVALFAALAPVSGLAVGALIRALRGQAVLPWRD